ncbi:metal-sensitive transcriptional regulator [Microbacterium invictum]|uniref:Metal-sensitive transcriptional regulator n=1 Tax=Microbacterium invictum TaxID=515415 RepID=A0ABZ0V833_9MICO|nr:metal-sensitive transcriptional regulator [Microbacterium invictum]WQB69762.1 metal-sensitive transcriptional regulator [Microbacterium invictum]
MTDTTALHDHGTEGTDATHAGPHGYISDKHRYLTRLRRVEGQVRGIQRMVEEEQYCIDILTQISALSSALENVALGLLDDHLKHCVVDAATRGGDEAALKLKEASDAIARLVKA